MQTKLNFTWNTKIGSLAALLLVATLLLTGCNATVDSGTGNAQTGGQVNPAQSGNASGSGFSGNTANGKKAGPASVYPDPNLTPGDVIPGVTSREVCVSGYSKTVRNVSAEEKAAVYQRYGIKNVPGQHEVDHFISLELGGSNDIKNLWPEPYEPRPGAHEKDTVENALHAEMCNGHLTLAQVQNIIRQDWYAYYLQISNK